MLKRHVYFKRVLICVLLTPLLAGCVSFPSPQARKQQIESLAASANWCEIDLKTDVFDLTSFVPASKSNFSETLTIYIEGDGLAWRTRTRVSSDPTPVKPVALLLALHHPDASVAYIARPCQLGQYRNCSSTYWTEGRFSPEIIFSFNQAIDILKEQSGSNCLQLVGYSGGGAIAALVAAQRKDVSLLVTVAGNLDHEAWTTYHRISPLSNSLNPVDGWRKLIDIPQVHFIGENDKNIPPFVAQSFRQLFPQGHRPEVISIKNTDHGCCWEKIWPELICEIEERLAYCRSHL